MSSDQIEITLSREKLEGIIKAYKVLGDFIDSVIPRNSMLQDDFRHGLESALREVELGQPRKISSFDEFIG